jgi:hypothetical protein
MRYPGEGAWFAGRGLRGGNEPPILFGPKLGKGGAERAFSRAFLR